jgi:hypothetical protein
MLVLGGMTYLGLRIVGLGFAAFFAIFTAVAMVKRGDTGCGRGWVNPTDEARERGLIRPMRRGAGRQSLLSVA